MKKTILLSFLTFVLGFLTHAFIFPDFLANGVTDVSRVVLPAPSAAPAQETQPLVTKITFDGKDFSRTNITVEFSRYLQITNTSKETLMWLTSNYPELTTERGYGETEAVSVRMDKRGQFVVADKNNPSERVVITVK